jgi:hypothetical protein
MIPLLIALVLAGENEWMKGAVSVGEPEVDWPHPDVMIARRLIDWGGELIEAAERHGDWRQSAQSVWGELQYDHHRNCREMVISRRLDPEMARFEEGLFRAFGRIYDLYRQQIPHASYACQDEGYLLLRYAEGQHYYEHVDAVRFAEPVFRQLSATLYLNEGFEGGDLVLPRQGLTLRPEAGMGVLFPAHVCYPHSAEDVRRGTRYAVVTWFSVPGAPSAPPAR